MARIVLLISILIGKRGIIIMRKFYFFCSIFFIANLVFAGDVANFVNLGFSADGQRFSFGQYGTQDGNYQSYAELYCVNVKDNKFVNNGIYTVGPDSSTRSKDSRVLFASVQSKASNLLKLEKIDSTHQGRFIYIQPEENNIKKNISFRDFEANQKYTVELKSFTEKSGKDVQSSFYLLVKKTDLNETEKTYTVGLPGYKRKGVKDYSIRSILSDNSGKSLVFIIEKHISDINGESVRYMVETLSL